jgi:hypothetical protein
MKVTNSKIKIPENNNNKTSILEAFYADPQKSFKRQNIFERPSSEQGSSPEEKIGNLSPGVVSRMRRTGSELIQMP